LPETLEEPLWKARRDEIGDEVETRMQAVMVPNKDKQGCGIYKNRHSVEKSLTGSSTMIVKRW
jgi:hypothetical protein